MRVVVSYEAGRNGFWILRALPSRGIDCYMVGAASVPVERHKRSVKTDRLDAITLASNLRVWLHGERDRMPVVRAPSMQDEALRRLIRDRGQLHKEVLQHRERIRKLLVTMGCWDEVDHRSFARRLAAGQLTCHDSTPLPDELRQRLLRGTTRFELAEQQLAALQGTGLNRRALHRDCRARQAPDDCILALSEGRHHSRRRPVQTGMKPDGAHFSIFSRLGCDVPGGSTSCRP